MDSSTFYLTNLFHQGSYTSFLTAFQSLTESPSDLLQLYAARSHLALTPPATAAALEILSKLPETLDSRAVTSLAQYLSGETETAVSNLEELLAETGEQGLADGDEGRMVRSIVGTVWIFEGEERREECIEVLREGIEIGKDEECLTLLAHLYQSLSHANLATALLQSPSTTAFTADSLLSQLLLARSQLATGSTAKYTEAGYVFEEIKGMQGGRGESVLSGVLVSEGLRGAWDEADAAGRESREAYPKDPTTLANVIALALHTGKSSTVEASLAELKTLAPSHPFLLDLEEKSESFDIAAGKFGIAV